MIGFLFRWIFRLTILGLVLIIGLVLLKDTIVRTLTENLLARATACPVSIQDADLSLGGGGLRLTGVRIYNPNEFGAGLMIHLPEVHTRLDADELLRGSITARSLSLHLAEVNVVKNPVGHTNLVDLSARLGAGQGTLPQINPHSSSFLPDLHPRFGGIEVLNLTLGRATLTDLSKPGNPKIINLGVTNEVFRGIRTTADLSIVAFRLALSHGFDWSRQK